MKNNVYEACERKVTGEVNISWQELAELFDEPNGNSLRNKFRRERDRRAYQKSPQSFIKEKDEFIPGDDGEEGYKESFKINEDGTQESDILILMNLAESKTTPASSSIHRRPPRRTAWANRSKRRSRASSASP